jgi:hypothetical protein
MRIGGYNSNCERTVGNPDVVEPGVIDSDWIGLLFELSGMRFSDG